MLKCGKSLEAEKPFDIWFVADFSVKWVVLALAHVTVVEASRCGPAEISLLLGDAACRWMTVAWRDWDSPSESQPCSHRLGTVMKSCAGKSKETSDDGGRFGAATET